MKGNITSKKIAITALLTACALIAFSIENLFPPLFIPGARLGLSNIFILLAIFTVGNGYAILVFLIKVVLGSLFAGNISAMLYSLPAGLIALTVQIIVIKTGKFSVVSASVLGSVINLTLQNIVFCLVTNTLQFLIYSPYLALIGCMAGLVVGLAVFGSLKALPKILLVKKQANDLEDSHSEH